MAVPSNRVKVLNLDPRTDFGRLHYRIPAWVLEPATQDQLVGCVRYLNAARIPMTIRGCAHSSDGQALSERGIVISTRRLRRILADSPAAQRIRVEGGALWADVVRHLRPQARAPLVLTSDLLTTVAGTLSAGGVGTASFQNGLQIATVTHLLLVLPTGDCVQLGPEDELFRYALGGVGQLGIIAEAEIRTRVVQPHVLVWHRRWSSVAEFSEAAARLRRGGDLAILRARFYCRTPAAPACIDAYAGIYCSDETANQYRAAAGTAPGQTSREVWPPDPIPDERCAPEATPEGACPALRFFLPVPAGLSAWGEIENELERAQLTPFLRTGSAINLVPGDRSFPLAPLPESDDCLFVGLYPEVPRDHEARAVTAMRRIADRVLDAGGRLDLTSIRSRDKPLEPQFGRALQRFRELKSLVDPHGLLNPGLL